jgi:hypothetical protein
MSKMYLKNLGVNLNCSGEHRRAAGRITRQNLQTLRSMAISKKEPGIFQKLRVAVSDLWFSMSRASVKKVHPMCNNYGHVIEDFNWKGCFPTCVDCGMEITHPSMLRKAAAVAIS